MRLLRISWRKMNVMIEVMLMIIVVMMMVIIIKIRDDSEDGDD